MWYNRLIVAFLKSPFYRLLGKNIMVIVYQGRKSGKEYSVPVNFARLQQNGEEFLVTTSLRTRKWWRNFRNSTAANVLLEGQYRPAHLQICEDAAPVMEHFDQLLRAYPQYARFLNVKLAEDGSPLPNELERLAQERVVIRTQLVSSA